MTSSWSGNSHRLLGVILDLSPLIGIEIEHMHVVEKLEAIVSSKNEELHFAIADSGRYQNPCVS